MKKLSGGNAGEINIGPGMFKEGYSTTACGRAARIEAGAGEICIRVSLGDPRSFSDYLVGSPEEVLPHLGSEQRARVEDALERAGLQKAIPVVLLSHALKLHPDAVAQALDLCGLQLTTSTK